jgi:hypothetical protein
MNKDIDIINNIFIEWNPIEVNKKSAETEYLYYCGEILSNKKDIIKLVENLENILLNKIGLDYDSTNVEHKKEVVYIAYKIYIS